MIHRVLTTRFSPAIQFGIRHPRKKKEKREQDETSDAVGFSQAN